ncbi:MAG TPA: hypothetical protein PLS53_04745 [Thermoanaerobaculaceae bacterium]|nr:hypothetical protein [Thermoanaerobaculaceae bacterium]HPS77443.1 hypothetical protein [Thermoanaerobaculaceae bacterium]
MRKSSLADRFRQRCGVVEARELRNEILDSMAGARRRQWLTSVIIGISAHSRRTPVRNTGQRAAPPPHPSWNLPARR